MAAVWDRRLLVKIEFWVAFVGQELEEIEIRGGWQWYANKGLALLVIGAVEGFNKKSITRKF